jgi:hypothetical protein
MSSVATIAVLERASEHEAPGVSSVVAVGDDRMRARGLGTISEGGTVEDDASCELEIERFDRRLNGEVPVRVVAGWGVVVAVDRGGENGKHCCHRSRRRQQQQWPWCQWQED